MSFNTKLLAVCVVTYQEKFIHTSACKSLSSLPEHLINSLEVVSVCNASPEIQLNNKLICKSHSGLLHYTEILRGDNSGLAGGYNDCLELALSYEPKAALFLNSDADVPDWYIDWLIKSIVDISDIDAFAPRLVSGRRCISPFHKRGMELDFYIIGYLCLRNGEFLRHLRFSKEFWLDGIDYWLSVKLAEAQLKVHTTDRYILHNLSVSDRFHSLPLSRYQNILLSERRFLKFQRRPFTDLLIIYSRAFLRCLVYQRFDLAHLVVKELIVAINE
jgi:hypothetical protein